ncbi:MAG TPA: TrmH family RNA methyltransferase [Myxococcota bacterium]|nr:TrmH family RNA methyltransferase [Myxococcota bacterium]HRY95180.1 TrmH family RNA methyltransferase [Myxococcota bacterium]HSA23393.1 TrmH family RNA methyltransferase [Myxococcota bacterium]
MTPRAATDLLARVRVVLVETGEGGNLGAIARAMRNTGLADLVLVDPVLEDWYEAHKRAIRARELVDQAPRVRGLAAAVAECGWVVGVSGRGRNHEAERPGLDLDGFLARVRALPPGARLALVFGSERVGLRELQLDLCHDLLRLPTDPAYPSMNLAAAVTVMAWELRKLALAAGQAVVVPAPPPAHAPATAGEQEELLAHAARLLAQAGFLNPQNPEHILADLRRILARARLDRREVAILRGACHKLEKRLRA